MRFRHLMTIVVALVVCTMTATGARPLKVLVLYDMEGVSEATSVQHTSYDTPEYKQARDEIDRRITAAARAGIEKLDAARLPEVAGPYRFALTFHDEAETANAALFQGAETALNARTAQVRSNDFEEGWRKSLRLLGLAGAAARETALRAVMATAPDAAAWRARIGEWNDERFLDRALVPPAPAPPAKPRYWGAR